MAGGVSLEEVEKQRGNQSWQGKEVLLAEGTARQRHGVVGQRCAGYFWSLLFFSFGRTG